MLYVKKLIKTAHKVFIELTCWSNQRKIRNLSLSNIQNENFILGYNMWTTYKITFWML